MSLHPTVTELFDCLPAGPALRTFVQYSVAFCTEPEAAIDVISGASVRLIVPDNNAVKFCDPGLYFCREIKIRPNAVGNDISAVFRSNC